MNCEFCKEHIVATMQISWRGYNYHQDCVGEAIAQYRAEQERIDNGGVPEFNRDFEPFEDEQYFEDEFTPYEENDDLEDVINALDNQPEVSDEILAQIPAPQPDFRPLPVNLPEGSVLVAPRAIIHPGNGTLIAGLKGSRYVDYPELRTLPIPETTNTFKPVSFYEFVTKLLQGLWDRRMNVVSDQYVISADGMKLFGLIELENEFNGVRFAIGLRTSNDKSTKLALAVGYKVMCCSNGMLQGDFLPLAVKHSANLELDDALALGIDRIRRRFGDLQSAIQTKQERLLEDTTAKECIYNAFTVGKFPVSLFKTVHSEYFEHPSYDEFRPRTLFSIENAFTTSFKKLQPIQQFQATARLGKFLATV